jgi:hypothetical protein
MPFWVVVREVEMGCGIFLGSRGFGIVGSSGNRRAEADYIACPS